MAAETLSRLRSRAHRLMDETPGSDEAGWDRITKLLAVIAALDQQEIPVAVRSIPLSIQVSVTAA